MKKLFMCAVFGISISSFGNSLLCPQWIVCKDQECDLGNMSDIFTIHFADTPIPNDTYYFSTASIRPNSIPDYSGCTYRNRKGNTWIVLGAKTSLTPDLTLSYSEWKFDGNKNAYCNPNTSKPYLSHSTACPFKRK
jgi:hypothetical protein